LKELTELKELKQPADTGYRELCTSGAMQSIGMIARWKPVHRGHAAVLQALVEQAQHALIGIGSSNCYDVRNPFTASETAEMIRIALDGRTNYSLIEVPDLGHGPRWRALVCELFGDIDLFVTANDYVRDLMRDVYRVVHPVHLVPESQRVRVHGTMVRLAMARGEAWQELVPSGVANFLVRNGLVDRFRREFGEATISGGDADQ
jgi:nicotinamide-nucleotide adenylyltransferase